jgi:N-acetylglucosamine-6-phosphate deacetylase
MIVNANIVAEDAAYSDGVLVFAGDKIEFIGDRSKYNEADLEIIDAGGSWVLPGFIDIHVHGGGGSDFMDADRGAFDTITRFHSSNGTTTMLATSVTAPKEGIERLLAALSEYQKEGMPYAQLLGAHLEGPFISPAFPGAQNPRYIVAPQLDWVKEWAERFPGVMRLITFAPESEGALEFAALLRDYGIVASAGHTNAPYDVVEGAVEHGLCHAVHTFNAMKGLHHREPGTAGAVLTDDRISAEIIADGHHVHPACIKMLTRTKPDDRLLLVTDAMSAAGLGNGTYDLGGLEVRVKDGVATLTDGHTLAGSTLTMIDAFRFMVRKIGLDVARVSRLASLNPAKRLGIDGVTGSLRAGKQADLLLVHPDLKVERVWVKGKEITEE